MNRRKILNDPVYGFITLRYDFMLDLIDHPYFQRLRRISQLGLSHLVYPGATHNRFHHAIGAMHLMQNAIEEIRLKGHEITEEEAKGACMAILLHDIGHGPFSHALEHTLVKGVSHEDISVFIMNELNETTGGMLDTAIEIFNDHYPKHFLHQLVSSQLDMDRLDYLQRDSFYSGVTEGKVGSERIIKMLNVVDDQLVVEEKGIYSIEKFIVARRLMYWQVYLHKTVLSAEFMLVNILKRAKHLSQQGVELFGSPALQLFLKNDFTREDFVANPEVLATFCRLDDYDILGAIKVWQDHDDLVLAELCQRLSRRDLFKIDLRKDSFVPAEIETKRTAVQQLFNLSEEDAASFVISDKIHNRAYSKSVSAIMIHFKDGSLKDVATASDHLNLDALSNEVEKHFLCYPKEVR
ncbi:MAG: HD domain-containing protein [Flavobacteriales bacterium]|nr:HD domain-containing protein [Flavobacteriales bacterium]MDG1779651.1 HD domain-containing protein [Flavobacteriales bacterium]MDG2246417.1 HD domain-containing protein [Flavobacteriales bacterium]